MIDHAVTHEARVQIEQILETAENDSSANAPGWFLEPAGLSSRPQSVAPPIGELAAAEHEPLYSDYSLEAIHTWRSLLAYHPKTNLGFKLLELRKQIVASGIRLLDADQISDELATRRAER